MHKNAFVFLLSFISACGGGSGTGQSGSNDTGFKDSDDKVTDTATETDPGSGTDDTDTQGDGRRPNVLFIMTDQQRFDALRRSQDERAGYDGAVKIRTPELDRLSYKGAYFQNAYSSCPVCAPDRTSMRTGCTIERTGMQTNSLVEEDMYRRMEQFEDKVADLVSYEQVLVEQGGYVAETYGKWHMPTTLYYGTGSKQPVISYNDYDYAASEEKFSPGETWGKIYQRSLEYHRGLGDIDKTFLEGQQENTFSKYPYDPTALDARYGAPTNTPLTEAQGYEDWEISQPNVMGQNSLSADYTSSHFNGDMAVRALDRLARQDNPFVLTVSFHNPHAPMVAAPEYFDYYFENRSGLFVSPSMDDAMENSAYRDSNGRTKLLAAGYGYDDPEQVRQWIAGYYALVEEIDTWVGILQDKLDEHGIADNTLVIYTSDHGEMLGAHGMREKNIFLEESVHIPLMISLPGKIPSDLVIPEPVTQRDLFATILDYTGLSRFDSSDGVSLRRFIEGKSYNKDYDERAVISEWDYRDPQDGRTLTRALGKEVNFMVRKGDHKLMLTKKADSNLTDMMYDLSEDPYELNNLIGDKGLTASNAVIGKAEHLKILLIEWMKRNNGAAGYYSDNRYNNGEGEGDIAEVTKRRKWKTLSYWQSDEVLDFGKAVWNGSAYVRNEYLYIGRTNSGTLEISSIAVKGADAAYFAVDTKSATVSQNEYVRVKVSFRSPKPVTLDSLDAHIEIKNDVHGTNTVQFGGQLF